MEDIKSPLEVGCSGQGTEWKVHDYTGRISLEEVPDDRRVYVKDGEAIYVYNVLNLFPYLQTQNKDPVANQPFDQEDLNSITELYRRVSHDTGTAALVIHPAIVPLPDAKTTDEVLVEMQNESIRVLAHTLRMESKSLDLLCPQCLQILLLHVGERRTEVPGQWGRHGREGERGERGRGGRYGVHDYNATGYRPSPPMIYTPHSPHHRPRAVPIRQSTLWDSGFWTGENEADRKEREERELSFYPERWDDLPEYQPSPPPGPPEHPEHPGPPGPPSPTPDFL
jgi:hypothetical protein